MRAREYRLQLRPPLPLPGGGALTHREGFLVVDPETGGVGDAAPLPGFSREGMEDLRRETARADWWIAPRFPSLRFAVECARAGNTPPESPVRVNALWWAERESVETLLGRLESWENPVVKIKPGPRPDPAVWTRFCRERPDAQIRLDPNRQWTLEQLRRHTEAVPMESLEYVEEPLGSVEALRRIPPGWEIPLALDETTREASPESAQGIPGVVAVVFKPTLMGDEGDRRPWMDLATARGWTPVWSAAFESGAGLWHLARLAAGGAPAGLDTAAALAEDVVAPRPLTDAHGLLHPRSWSLTSSH